MLLYFTRFSRLLTIFICLSAIHAGVQASYSKNSNILVIEDIKGTGLYIQTSENNYAFINLNAKSRWAAVSVNENKLFIVESDDKTAATKTFASLRKSKRELIEDIRASYLSNKLVGLNLLNPSENSYQSPVASHGYSAARSGYGSAPAYSNPAALGAYGTNLQYPNFNYHNLAGSHLPRTLAGDVYNFDFKGRILDLFTSTVSVHVSGEESYVFRDFTYFTHYAPNLPLSINRFFLFKQYVFFIYNDGSVVVKSSSMLDASTLEVIVKARFKVKELQYWDKEPASLKELGPILKELWPLLKKLIIIVDETVEAELKASKFVLGEAKLEAAKVLLKKIWPLLKELEPFVEDLEPLLADVFVLIEKLEVFIDNLEELVFVTVKELIPEVKLVFKDIEILLLKIDPQLVKVLLNELEKAELGLKELALEKKGLKELALKELALEELELEKKELEKKELALKELAHKELALEKKEILARKQADTDEKESDTKQNVQEILEEDKKRAQTDEDEGEEEIKSEPKKENSKKSRRSFRWS